jgi:glutamate dehydrogenase/leucine dehydrogenase
MTAAPDASADVLSLMGDEHEQVVYLQDAEVGLRAIVAIHSTVLGPAMGGTRFLPYRTETQALADVLRLARGMTYKQAVAGIDYGGGKAVIIGRPAELHSPAFMRSYGRMLDRLGGVYLTAEDVGTTQADMDLIADETPYVTGTSPERGGSGDPSPATAWGVLHAMRAAAEHLWGVPELTGRHVVVAGVGKVGAALVGHLHEEGTKITVADPDTDAVASLVARYDVAVASHHEAHRTPCDLYAPCALGGVLTARTIPELRCAAVVGAANNQLDEPADAERLDEAGVLYVPDYVANAGGVINISEEPSGYDRDRALHHVAGIYETTLRVLERASSTGTTPAQAADGLAEERLAAARRSSQPS